MNNFTSVLLALFFVAAIGGVLVALVAHLAFLRSLAKTQPELWRAYRRIAFTFEHTTLKHRKLMLEVYSQLNNQAVIRTRRWDVICSRIFGISLFITALAFGISRLVAFL